MSHRQLKAKAAGYGEYVQLDAWRERDPFCPALLFITTSEKRARSFLAAADREIDSARMLVASVGLARDLRRCITAPEWMVGDGEQAIDLLGILRAARRPYDEANEREEAQAALAQLEDSDRDSSAVDSADALAVLSALPDLGKSLIAADPDVRRAVFDAFRLRVEIDRNDGRIRLKALVSSAFGEARNLSDLGDAVDPALSVKAIPLRGFEPRFPD